MEEYKIYSLIDPITNEIRYVGKTVSPLYKRLSSHYRDKKKSYKTNWINTLRNKGLKPLIKLIEICKSDNWEEREKHWISYYRKVYSLTNYLDGGQGQQKGYKHTDEAKEKIRLASIKNTKGKFYKGQNFTDETNKKRSESNKKVIYQYGSDYVLIKKWAGIIDASNELCIDKNNIRFALTGKAILAGGFVWTYTENEFSKINNKRHRKIYSINIETNEKNSFNSIKEACDILNIERKHIENSLRSKTVKFNLIFNYE